ncbi:MAG: radical SAM protein [Desulfobacteraceae bacterium]|nr:radical SAM protein [Desulfobacteraceae bacterium]
MYSETYTDGSDKGPKQIDIAFFFCPYTGHPPPHRFDINHGPAYLAAYLKNYGLNSSFYYGRYDNDPAFGRIIKYLDQIKPRFIGFTVYESNLPETACLSAIIKENFPKIPILWGGPQVRFHPERILKKHMAYVDVCVFGEGELPLKLLLEKRMPLKTKQLSTIGSITYFNRQKDEIVSNPIGPTLLDSAAIKPDTKNALDLYPSPFLEGIIPDQYFFDKSVVSIFTSRGCPYQCLYCQFSSLTSHKVLFHSVDRVMEEIKWIHAKVKQYHPYKKEIMVMIFDEALTLSRKRIEILCRTLTATRFDPPLKLWVETRADHVDEALLRLLKEAGVKKINFGLESAVPRVLKRINKVSNNTKRPIDDVRAEEQFLKKIEKAVGISKKLGMYTSVSVIVGLPEETLDNAKQTLEFVEQLPVDMYYHNFLNVLDGTRLSKEADQLGYDWKSRPAGYMGKYGHRYTKAPIHTRSLKPLLNARIYIRDKARFRFLLRGYIKNTLIKRKVNQDKSRTSYWPFVLDLSQCRDWDGNFLNRLSLKLTGLSATLFCRDNILFKDQGASELLRALSLKNGRLYCLPENHAETGRILGIEEADHSTPYFFPFKYFKFKPPLETGRSIFLRIDDQADADAFFEESDHYLNMIETGRNVPGTDDLPFELFEACRWVHNDDNGCPAGSMTHLYLDDKNTIRPCRNFPAMTEPGEIIGLEKIKERIRSYRDKIMEDRGCHSCEIQRHCPRCVAPFPLTGDQYCRFQKNRIEQKEHF